MAVEIANSTIAARDAIGALNHALAPFKAFSTNFSADVSYAGDGVAVLVFSSSTANTVTGIEGDVDYDANSSLSTAVQTVTILDSFYASSALKSAQYNAMSPSARVEMKKVEMRAVISKFFAYAEEKLTANALTYSLISEGKFTFEDAMSVRQQAVQAGHDPEMLSLLLPAPLYSTLAKDEAISKSFYEKATKEAIQEGRVTRCGGMDVYECVGLTKGFLVTKDSAAVACRYVPVDGIPVCEAVVDRDSGIVITSKEFPNPNTDKVISVSHLYAGFEAIKGGYSIAIG